MSSSERLPPIDAAVLAVRRAVREGASEAEAYIVWSKGYRVVARAGRLESLEAVDDIGIGVRAVVGKRVGFAYATSLERDRVEEVARRAVKVARTSPEDKYWRGLPSPSSSYPEPEAIYEPSLVEVGPEDIVSKVKEALEIAMESGVQLVSAASSVLRIERAIASTQGVYRIDVGTLAFVTSSVSVQGPEGSTPAVFHFESARTVIPSGEQVTRVAIEKAKLCTRRVKLDSPRRVTVVFTSEALAELFQYTLGSALRGDMAAQGRSPYTGKIGENVASESLTVVDDGVMKGGDNTWRFDGEGVATRRKVIIEKGVLRTFVLDSYWAGRLGSETTGNAVRSGYASPPQPGYTNIVVEAGDARIEDILDGETIVVYQVQGAHSSNPETGEYSVLANPAVLYRNGEPVGWVPGLMVSSNMYEDVRSRLTAVSRVVEHGAPGFYAPWLRFEDIMVAPKT